MTISDDRPKPAASRLQSVDLLRGLVMVLMVLDHVRDFFGDLKIDATDPAVTNVPLFFSRWITHYCAPTFVFLAGTGAYLAGHRGGMSRGELRRFLITRGLWLALLEITVVRLGMTFDLSFRFIPLTVLWAIGWSMVALAGLIALPLWAIAAFGLVMIAGHNAMDGIRPESFEPYADAWRILHVQSTLDHTFFGRKIFALYSLVPWIGVMACGYSFGAIVSWPDRWRRRGVILALGVTLTIGFLALRYANVYGDSSPWSRQTRGDVFTFLSFLNTTKYPPSLLYLMMTLGPALMVLALLDGGLGPLGHPLRVFGRVPLFYYLLQWPLIHLLAVAYTAARGLPYRWLLGSGPFQRPDDYGYPLSTVFAAWVVTVAALYPPCLAFAWLKARHRDWRWLSYF